MNQEYLGLAEVSCYPTDLPATLALIIYVFQERDRVRMGLTPVAPPSQPVALSASRPSGSITSGFPLRSSANLASVASSLMSTVAPSLPVRLTYTQAAAQIAATQAQQSQRYYPVLREH